MDIPERNIIIRRATIADAAVIAALSNTTFYDTFSGTCTEADMQQFLQASFNIDKISKELADEHDWYYLATIDGIPAGYMRLKEEYESFPEIKKWKALELKRIYVDKPYHGMGLAQQLMQVAENLAKDNQYEVLWLGVWEYNFRAKRFYEKCGFTDSGFTHDFPIGNTPQTDNWYWKFYN
jgi:diamine N-acetyltransferase